MRIGLLEVSPAIAELVCTTLHMAGHTVCAYVSAASLLERVCTESSAHALRRPHDLLILDILIDDAGEFALLMQLDRALSEQLPLMVLTASHADQIAQARQAYPHIAFLSKPFHLKTLLSRIETQAARLTEPSPIR